MTLLTPAPTQPSAPEATPSGSPTGSRPSAGLALRYVAAAASLGSAGIHFAVLPEHWLEWVGAGLFFGVVAWLQVGWAVALVQTRNRLVPALGALGQLGVVGVWVLSRTVGLPIGPQAGEAEPVAFIDVLSTVLEVTAAVCAGLLLTTVARRALRRGVFVGGTGVLALGVAVATTASLVPSIGGHEHSHAAGETALDGHSHAAVTGDVPVGWVTGCHQHAAAAPGAPVDPADIGHGAGNCTDAPVTTAQRTAAEGLVAATTASVTAKYPTLEAAQKAGYIIVNETGPLIHVGMTAWMRDGHLLDPNRVESLVYAKFGGGSMLLGAMYVAEPTAPQGPLIGGALTSWHVHTNLCVNPSVGTALNPNGGQCPAGSAISPTAQMLHVWTIPYTGGPFADISTPALITAVTSELQRRGAAAGQPG
ncbi:MAG: hypothetical protein QOJ32_2525 [Frankiaceae bacterium]|nr:hypothetical protein [Frankiaceae bacterium]